MNSRYLNIASLILKTLCLGLVTMKWSQCVMQSETNDGATSNCQTLIFFPRLALARPAARRAQCTQALAAAPGQLGHHQWFARHNFCKLRLRLAEQDGFKYYISVVEKIKFEQIT